MAKTIFEVLHDKITVEIQAAEDHLSSGDVKDYSEYRGVCGLIRGLKVALREVHDLSRNYMDDDND